MAAINGIAANINSVTAAVVIVIEKIKPGDIAVFWSIRYFAITTLGLITEAPYWNEDEEMNFINVAISQFPMDKWINGNKIKNEKVEYSILSGPVESILFFGGENKNRIKK